MIQPVEFNEYVDVGLFDKMHKKIGQKECWEKKKISATLFTKSQSDSGHKFCVFSEISVIFLPGRAPLPGTPSVGQDCSDGVVGQFWRMVPMH